MQLKHITTLLIILLFSMVSSAQKCRPDQSITEPGFYPDTLAWSFTGTAYKETLNIRIIKDTLVTFSGQTVRADIDSAILKKIMGLPSGFSYACNKTNCSFVPTSTGCATVIGSPENGQEGTYPIKMVITMFAKIFGSFSVDQTDTIELFEIVIKNGTAGIVNHDENKLEVYPNPSKGVFTISKKSKWKCYSTTGLLIKEGYSSTIDISGTKSGVYLLESKNNGLVFYRKLIVSH